LLGGHLSVVGGSQTCAFPWNFAMPKEEFSSGDPMHEKTRFWWAMLQNVVLAYH
jgi:hypothetical protein